VVQGPRLAIVGVALLVAVVAAACAGTSAYEPLPRPDPVETVPTTSTVPFDLEAVPLGGVPGTTTTVVAIGPGPVTIVGRVEGPDGPIGGAIVRLERLVGDDVATVEVPTAADGTWNIADVLGGRYRVRAWRQPSLAMVRAEVVFIEAPRSQPLILRLERFEGTRVDSAVAPNPPIVGEEANLKVRVTDRVVDERGVVRSAPRPGVSVALSGSGAWSSRSPNPSSTGPDGTVTFRLVCRRDGNQPLSVVLDGQETVPLTLPACFDPTATTTTTATTTNTDDTDDTDSTTTTTTTSTTTSTTQAG
jgi:hypothetical protein